MQQKLRKEQALEYHSKGRPGKIEVIPFKRGKGVMIYLPGEGPRGRKTDETLKKILGEVT